MKLFGLFGLLGKPKYDVKIDIPLSVSLFKVKKAQLMLANECVRLADDYVPFDTGVLKNSVRIEKGGKEIVYDTPYARYMYYGKLMVDPITKKGAFFNETYGFWSRPNTKKELSERDLEYHNNETGLRGAFWFDRMWATYGKDICRNIENNL